MSIFHPEEERAARELFAQLEVPVELALVLGPTGSTTLAGAREIDPEAESRRILSELASYSDLIAFSEHGEGAFGAERYPCVVFLRDGEDVGVRFYGTPWGYELTSLVGGIVEVGKREPSLQLPPLARDLALQVFVTPTWPHCPRAVLSAFRAALASPRVTATAIEATEFPALADAHEVLSVPKTVIGDTSWEGAVPEQLFVQRVLSAAG